MAPLPMTSFALLAALLAGGPAFAQAQTTEPRFQPSLSGGHSRDAFISSHDADGDGVVTREEMRQLRQERFAEADADADGSLSPQEYVDEYEKRLKIDYAAQSREPDDFYRFSIAQSFDRFAILDLDKDGAMTLEEYMTAADRAFDSADVNGDGVVSAEDPPRRRGAAAAFLAPPEEFAGRLKVENEAGGPILPGAKLVFSGSGLKAGQSLRLMRGGAQLNAEPLVADAEGGFSFSFALPEEAAVGTHEVAVLGTSPVAASTLKVKISPDVPLSGTELFAVESRKLVPGLYQAAYASGAKALFVSAASFGGRGAAPASKLLKLDPQTLEILAEASPPTTPEGMGNMPGPLPIAVFGLGLDEKHGRVWATNTIQNTLAVYDQSDLSLVKQFEPGLIRHVREIVIDAARDRAYASGSASNEVLVVDVAALEPLQTIRIVSAKRGGDFTAMGLALDEARGRLYVSSRTSDEIAEIDLESGEVLRVLAAPGAANPAGIAVDSARGRLLISAQDGDNLTALNLEDGKTIFQTPVGAGAMSAAVDPESGRAYVANRGAGTLTVVGPDGAILANLAGGSYPNHAVSDGAGGVYLVNKSLNAEDPLGDRISRISPAKAE